MSRLNISKIVPRPSSVQARKNRVSSLGILRRNVRATQTTSDYTTRARCRAARFGFATDAAMTERSAAHHDAFAAPQSVHEQHLALYKEHLVRTLHTTSLHEGNFMRTRRACPNRTSHTTKFETHHSGRSSPIPRQVSPAFSRNHAMRSCGAFTTDHDLGLPTNVARDNTKPQTVSCIPPPVCSASGMRDSRGSSHPDNQASLLRYKKLVLSRAGDTMN